MNSKINVLNIVIFHKFVTTNIFDKEWFIYARKTKPTEKDNMSRIYTHAFILSWSLCMYSMVCYLEEQ